MDADWDSADRCDHVDPSNVTEYLDCIKHQIIETQREIERWAPGNFTDGFMVDPEFSVEGGSSLIDDDCEEGGRDAHEICDRALLHLYLLGYCYPALLTLCLFGNTLNLVVYTVKYLRKSLTVKLLTMKAIMNSLFMIGLSPQVIILLFNRAHDESLERAMMPTEGLNSLWSLWPYSLFLSNVAGTCATW